MNALNTQGSMGEIEQILVDQGFTHIAGIDEVGRGACCGPMVMAACILPAESIPELATLTDSKKLTAKRREALFDIIKEHALSFAIDIVTVNEITDIGLQECNIMGMRRAAAALSLTPDYILTDALKVPGLAVPHLPIIKGDSQARCISAASVLAKVTRDRMMVDMDTQYPGYGIAKHKGYGTQTHMDAVRLMGGTPEHRYTYSNVAAAHQQWVSSHTS